MDQQFSDEEIRKAIKGSKDTDYLIKIWEYILYEIELRRDFKSVGPDLRRKVFLRAYEVEIKRRLKYLDRLKAVRAKENKSKREKVRNAMHSFESLMIDKFIKEIRNESRIKKITDARDTLIDAKVELGRKNEEIQDDPNNSYFALVKKKIAEGLNPNDALVEARKEQKKAHYSTASDLVTETEQIEQIEQIDTPPEQTPVDEINFDDMENATLATEIEPIQLNQEVRKWPKQVTIK